MVLSKIEFAVVPEFTAGMSFQAKTHNDGMAQCNIFRVSPCPRWYVVSVWSSAFRRRGVTGQRAGAIPGSMESYTPRRLKAELHAANARRPEVSQ